MLGPLVKVQLAPHTPAAAAGAGAGAGADLSSNVIEGKENKLTGKSDKSAKLVLKTVSGTTHKISPETAELYESKNVKIMFFDNKDQIPEGVKATGGKVCVLFPCSNNKRDFRLQYFKDGVALLKPHHVAPVDLEQFLISGVDFWFRG